MDSKTFMYIVWAAAALIFSVAEGITVQLVSIWFVIGAAAAFISAVCGASVTVQVIVFAAVTVVTLVATRPIVKKKINVKAVKTNADRCIGEEATVISQIDNLNGTGQVKINSVVWSARSLNNMVIPEGETVVIEKIEGVKVIVKTKER